jgi:putative zinc finger/helix-turn-helix YgiT family protein
MSLQCASCGDMTMDDRHGDFSYEWPEEICRKPSVFRSADWRECRNCGAVLLSPPLVERIETKRYKISCLLTPEEVKAARTGLGLTQIEMARRLGVGDKSYTRWESGLSIQSRAIDTLIRAVILFPDVLTAVEQARHD